MTVVGVLALCLCVPSAALALDCNGNGIDDDIDIAGNTSLDCNNNGVPDECELGMVAFSEQKIITTAANDANSVFSADLDGDGDLDVLSASSYDRKIAWYENIDGLGTFGPQRTINSGVYGAQSVFAADLDGDGDVDVLSASTSSKIAWYENTDGLGSFGPSQIITTLSGSAFSVYAADLDSDGDIDVLSSGLSNDKIAWYENVDGLGGFGPQRVITSAANGARSVFAADLDGDGDLDVLSASEYDGMIAWYENTDGSGLFGPTQIITLSASGARSVFSADLDGDGDHDVLSASTDEDKVAWYENMDGTGTFGVQQVITTDADFADSVFAADLDSDGDVDVLSASSFDDKIAWYENVDGLGGFGLQLVITTDANFADFVFAADLDGDGDLDVLSASEGDNKIAWYENGALNDCNNNGVPDACDIADAPNTDCNNNSMPDGCELEGNDCNATDIPDDCEVDGNDCNNNGLPDDCELAGNDCNSNGAPDECELTDNDCDNNMVPDDCQLTGNDCNINGTLDHCDIADLASADCNNNGLPDECELASSDCNNNATPDDCDIASLASTDCNNNGVPDDCDPAGPDCNLNNISDDCDIAELTSTDCNNNGVPDDCELSGNDCDSNGLLDECEIQTVFSGQQIIALANNGAFTSGDLDGDGDADILLASGFFSDFKLAWYDNTDGLGNFGLAQVITTEVVGATSVFVADLDGDHDLDVLSASDFDSKIAWYENVDGKGGFGPQLIITTIAAGAQSVFAADIDGDGDVDVLSASAQDDTIAWYENTDRLGTFGSQQEITTAADGARSVHAADLDGDGDVDVLSASSNDDKIAWYENTDGLGNFGPQQEITTAADGARSVYAADLDGDGDVDVLSASSNDDKIAWYESTDGLGSYGSQRVITTSADAAQFVFAADLDGDGDADVLSASASDDKIAWYQNLIGIGGGGTDGFAPEQVITTAADGASSVRAADVDGDGDLDVLSTSVNDSKVAWYKNSTLNDCNKNWTLDECDVANLTSTDCNNNSEPDECEPDCNLNGIADACDITNTTSEDCNTNGVPDDCEPDCNLNGVADACDIAGMMSGDCNTNGVPDECEPDCDGDGVTDDCEIAAGTSDDCNANGTPDNCDIMSGAAGDCNTNGVPDVCEFEPVFSGQQLISTAVEGPRSIFIADFDGDGDADVLSASYDDDEIAWHENIDGAGTFGPRQVITTAVDQTVTVHAADLDGDGDIDVLSASYADDKIAWYENVNGLGNFGEQQVITLAANGASSVFAADIDGDGDVDVLSASSGTTLAERTDDNKIAWYENTDGLGEFGSQQVITTAAVGSVSVSAADLDGDGDVDVLSASYADDKIAWYENTDGLGSFHTQPAITTMADSADSVVPADLDGDGDFDVISLSAYDNKVAWYENTDGFGDFGPQQVITTAASGLRSVFAVDLDRDGDTDLLSASIYDDKITWYENIDGRGDFGAHQVISTAADGAYCVFAADMDGDGDTDVLSASILDNKIAWYAVSTVNDCNNNRILDECDISEATSADCNTNSVPDDCELTGNDCNSNGVPDDCELGESDCNCNDILDETDIAEMTSSDCNNNGVPDECDVAGGDCNNTGIPDECELENNDCNSNGVPDECELVVDFNDASGLLTPIGGTAPQSHEILSPPLALGVVTLAFTANADFGFSSEFISIDVNGTPVGDVFFDSPECTTTSDQLVVSAELFNEAVAGGHAMINMIPSGAVSTTFCHNAFVSVAVSYRIADDCNTNAIPDECEMEISDCNSNGVLDECEPAGDDCNFNYVPDGCDIAEFTSSDCNHNGIPDECELASNDCNSNSVPDECELEGNDCNSNGIPDGCDIADLTSDDCNTNGIPDGCDTATEFLAHVITTAADNARFVFAADLDGDGDPDVLSASNGDHKIAWYQNSNGLGTFGAQQVISTAGFGPAAVFAEDLDGDGDLDVLSASSSDDEIAWYENTDGLGVFGPQQVITNVAHAATSVFATDLDGDGDADVLSASEGDGKIAWYENTDGLGSFGFQQVITKALNGPQSVFATDLDGDGDADVLSASRYDDKIAWYENIDGLGGFSSQQVITTAASGAYTVFAADLDGDGDTDVLSASFAEHKIAWYENIDGLGTFGPQRVITTSARSANSVFAADLDSDGDLDVLSASSSDDKIAWYENTDGQGGFGPQQVITAFADGARSVFAVDLDGDGDIDVISASSTDDKVAWYENTGDDCNGNRVPDSCELVNNDCNNNGLPDDCELSDNDCNANNVPDECDLVGTDCNSNAVPDDCELGDNDCNNNGVPDDCELSADDCNANDSPDECDIAELTSSDCNLNGVPDDCELEATFSSQKVISTTVTKAIAVSAADMDGDGDADVLSASYSGGQLAWYENTDRRGNFGPPNLIGQISSGPLSIISTDLDGDGDADVLAPWLHQNKVVWYENTDLLGSFGSQNLVTDAVDGATYAFAADLDGDGDEDVLSASFYDGRIAWYENTDGLGGFGLRQTITTDAEYAYSVFAEDLDGDGDFDVLSASSGDSKIAWYENLIDIGGGGADGFGPQQVITTLVGGAWSVFAADLDGDGDADALSASTAGNLIAWYENTDGLGNFGPQVVITNAAGRARFVFAADLDGDGDIDVLSASTTDNKIAWYENTDGLGAFGPQKIITTDAEVAQCVFAADLDGDGDNDVLSASDFDNKIAWYENYSTDCNGNRVLDECDLANGTSNDCNNNSVPDECELATFDCNSNGVPDDCDIAALTSSDCDNDGVADECRLVVVFSEASGALGPLGGTSPQSYTLISPPLALHSVELAFTAYADLGSLSEFISIDINGSPVGDLFVDAQECGTTSDQIVLSAAVFNAAVAGGDAVINLVPSSSVNALSCGSTQATVKVQYNALDDCNGNRIPDRCESDVDGDGLIDDCESCPGGVGSGDSDADGIVDLADFTDLEPCFSAPDSVLSTGCNCFDFDGDNDIDLQDFAAFQVIFDP